MGFMRPWVLFAGSAFVLFVVCLELWHAARIAKSPFPQFETLWRSRKRREALALALFSAFMVVAIAGPYVEAIVPTQGLCAIFALDVSRSMLATDYASETRFDRAKLAVRMLVKNFPVGRAGYIAFAGDAMVRKIRTSDLAALADDLSEETIESTEKTGSNLGAAIVIAAKLAKDYYVSAPKAEDRCTPTLVVLSDGGHEYTALEVAPSLAELRALGVRIVSIGFGTTGGADVKIGEEMYRAILNETALKDIASATSGSYTRIVTGKELAEVFLRRQELTVPLPPRKSNVELFYVPLVLAGIAIWRFLAKR